MSAQTNEPRLTQPRLPFFERLKIGTQTYLLVAVSGVLNCIRVWKHHFYPRDFEPELLKTYKTRPMLPIMYPSSPPSIRTQLIEAQSIYYPPSYDRTSTKPLPTLFTIHGGGYMLGHPLDDQKWNRDFCDTHSILLISLNYRKAPIHPFPTAIHDLSALILATLSDSSLPIDKSHCAITGFSAGGNLALAVCQLPEIAAAFAMHGSPGFRAVIPFYPGLDRTVPRDVKAGLRQYKSALSPKRNSPRDILLRLGKLFDWAYVPVGHDLRDPLLCPIFAKREDLPKWVFVIACELDLNSHEAWMMACGIAGREVPGMELKSGREEVGKVGELEEGDERFAWEEEDTDGKGGVRWLLVPDVVHGYDHMPPMMLGDEISVKDAAMKRKRIMEELGVWLKTRVWVEE